MTPKEVVSNWVEAFNSGDADLIAGLYSLEAINFQVAEGEVRGRDSIKERFSEEFAAADMVCIVENLFEEGEWAILEWKDPLGLRGCGFFHVVEGEIIYQRGYWDKLSFLRQHNLPIPHE